MAWLLVVTAAFVTLVIASSFVMRWFDVQGGGGRGFWGAGTFTIDLRRVSIENCHAPDFLGFPSCTRTLGTVPRGVGLWSRLANETSYPTLALVTFWMSMAFGALVLSQVGSRLLMDAASPRLMRLGWLVGALVVACAGVTGYVVIPNIDSNVRVQTTWTPLVLVLAVAVGCVLLYWSAKASPREDDCTRDDERHRLSVALPRARALP